MIGGALGVVYAAVNLLAFPRWTVDDAYITYRYAENLASHGALVFNYGHGRVEGYTGIALPGVLGALHAVGIATDGASHVIGIVAFFGTVAALAWTLHLLRARPAIIAAAVVVFCTMPIGFTHATSGLETMSFEFAITLSAALLARTVVTGRGDGALCVALLVTSLVRPDGVVVAAVFTIALGVTRWRQGRFGPFLRRFELLYLLPAGAYFVWRVVYYRSLLPNTYYVKSTNFNAEAARTAFEYFATWFALLAVGALIAVLVVRSRASRPPGPTVDARVVTGLAAITAAALLAVSYMRSNLENDYSFRFFAPTATLILVALVALVVSARASRYRWTAALLALGVTAQVALNIAALPHERSQATAIWTLARQEDIKVGTLLRRLPANEWIATYQAGAVPYCSRHPAIDLLGLNDRRIARTLSYTTGLAPYVYAHHPGALVLYNKYPPATLISRDPRISGYVLLRRFRTTAHAYRGTVEDVYVRRDLVPLLMSRQPSGVDGF